MIRNRRRVVILVGLAVLLTLSGAAVVLGAFPVEGGLDPLSPLNAPVDASPKADLVSVDVPVATEVLALAPTWLPGEVELCQVDIGLSDVTRRYCRGTEPVFAVSAIAPGEDKPVIIAVTGGATISLSDGRRATLVHESVTSTDESGATVAFERIGLAVYGETSDLPQATIRSLGDKPQISEKDLVSVADSLVVGPPLQGVPINLEALMLDSNLARIATTEAGGNLKVPSAAIVGVRGTFIFFGNKTWLAENGTIEYLAE